MAARRTIVRISAIFILVLALLSSRVYAIEPDGSFPTFPPPVVFSTQPQNVTASVGETAMFSVAAIGAPPLSYQWRKSGVPIDGATDTQLVLSNITEQNFGYYDVRVTNSLGEAQSKVAFLLRPASLEVFPAVEVVMQLEPFWNYALESSADLSTWTVLEPSFTVSERQVSRFFPAREQKVYYRARLLVVPTPIVAPRTADSLQDPPKIYSIRLAGDTNVYTLKFPAIGVYELTQSGLTNRGTAAEFLREANTWTFNVISNTGQSAGSVRMQFTGFDQGSWVYFTEGQAPSVGHFFISPEQRLVGKTLQLTYVLGGGERFDFLDETTVSYEQGLFVGTYTYSSFAGVINVTLSLGWTYEIDINRPSNSTVIFRENPNITPDIQQATFTLD